MKHNIYANVIRDIENTIEVIKQKLNEVKDASNVQTKINILLQVIEKTVEEVREQNNNLEQLKGIKGGLELMPHVIDELIAVEKNKEEQEEDILRAQIKMATKIKQASIAMSQEQNNLLNQNVFRIQGMIKVVMNIFDKINRILEQYHLQKEKEDEEADDEMVRMMEEKYLKEDEDEHDS